MIDTVKPSAPNPPSDLFQQLVCDAGTPKSTCGFCGRFHIAAEGYLEEGELKQFRENAALSPGRYIIHQCQSLSIGELVGMNWVEGCECNILWRYENFIWTNRQLIVEYLKARQQEQAKQAAQLGDGLKSL